MRDVLTSALQTIGYLALASASIWLMFRYLPG